MARLARRLIRVVAASLAALLLLGLAGVVALVLFVDADRFRPRIERAASSSLGRPVALGRLHWDLGWRIGLSTEGGSVANAPGFEGEHLASWRRIDFGLALRPLLRRNIRVDHLAVEGLVLDLQRKADGRANWSFDSGPSPEDRVDPPRDRTGRDAARFELGSLALSDASLRFRDEAAVRDVSLQSVDLGISLPPDLGAQQLEFAGFELAARLKDWPLHLHAEILRVDRQAQSVDVPAFEAGFDESLASGSLQARGGDSPQGQAVLRLSVPSLRTQLERLGRPLSPMQDASVPGATDLTASVHFGEGVLRLEDMKLKVDETTLTGRVEFSSLDPLAVRFDLDADQVNVDRYLEPEGVQSDPYELPVRRLRDIDARGTLRILQTEALGASAHQSVITVE